MTVKCPGVDVGEEFTLNDVTYTRRSLTAPAGDGLINVLNQAPMATTCTTGITEMSNTALGGTITSSTIDVTHFDTDLVTTLESTFSGSSIFDQKIGAWNTSLVTTMLNTFLEATSFNQAIGDWDTSSVQNMNGMFKNASSFNQPIGEWNTSKVGTMNGMFYGASGFNQPIGGWDTASVTDMSAMFRGASGFNQPIGDRKSVV